MPLVSVIIPSFNRKNLLERALRSVLKQTFHNYEILAVDDGSTDGTEELCILNHPKIKFLRLTDNGGVSRARNTGINASSGEWIAFLDSDDEWFSRKLEKQIKWIHENPDFVINQTKEIWIRNGRRVNPPSTHEKFQGDLFAASLERCMITPSSVLIKKSLFDEVGIFNESVPACEDYDLWLRITSRYTVGLLDEYLLKRYGGHQDQLSSATMGMDRFRIRSMMDLLSYGSLNDHQRYLVITMLINKSSIVANGYLKRGNTILYERYRKIAQLFSTES